MEPIFIEKSSKPTIHRIPNVFKPGPNLFTAFKNDLKVDNDLDAIMKFITPKISVVNTMRMYCKEIETFLLWLEFNEISFTQFTSENCTEFSKFLCSPKPIKLWVGPRQKKVLDNGCINKKWRPLSKSNRSKGSVRSALRKVHSLYRFLKINSYVKRNPVPSYLMVDDTLRELEKRYDEKTLSPHLTEFILNWLKRKANFYDYNYQIFINNREFIIFYILIEFGLKITELSELKLTDFLRINQFTYLQISGNNQRMIKLTTSQCSTIDKYISYIDCNYELEALCDEHFLSKYKDLKPLCSRQISTIIKKCLLRASKVIINHYNQYNNSLYKQIIENDILKCQAATAQWLRNTCGTIQIENQSTRSLEAMKILGNHVPLSTIMYQVNSLKRRESFTEAQSREIKKIYDNINQQELLSIS